VATLSHRDRRLALPRPRRRLEVEDLARVDRALKYKLHQMQQEAAHRRGSAQHSGLREEQRLAIELDPMRDTT
jgi:hypothetical protein